MSTRSDPSSTKKSHSMSDGALDNFDKKTEDLVE
jgi:hypothetical protein